MTRRSALLVVSAAVLCAWCGWVSGFHRSTTPAWVTWLISLAGVVAVDLLLWRGRRGRRSGLRVGSPAAGWPTAGTRRTAALAGVAPWVVLALVVLAWEILGIDTGRHIAHLTISALTQAYRPLNAAMLLVWMGVGIGYGVVRARSPSSPPSTPAPPGDGSPAAWWWALPAMARSGSPTMARPPVPGLLLPDNRAAGVAFWLGVVAVAVLIDLGARRSDGRVATAEQFLRVATAPMAANVFWVAAWIFAGYHLFAR